MRVDVREMNPTIHGKVIDVLDDTKIVINKGAKDGVIPGNRFLIYREGRELTDPDTGENLGRLELVCGEGEPSHIQDRMTTLTSAKTKTRTAKTVVQNGFIWGNLPVREEYHPEESVVPFENVEAGCLFKQIK